MTWMDIVFLLLTGIPSLCWIFSLVTNARSFATTHRLTPLSHPKLHPEKMSAMDEQISVNNESPTDQQALEQDRSTLPSDDVCLWSMIVPACDEEEAIENTIKSLLAQGQNGELIVINDRSTDNTGFIIDRFATQDPRMTALHIRSLPSGWLGKLNALHQGVQLAKGTWLVLMDADVVMTPGALQTAIAYAEKHKLNLLTAVPRILSAGFWGDLAINATSTLLGSVARFWQVPNPQSDAVAGLGAFLLIRRSAFLQTPGFPWLKLEVADDVGVGLMMKQYMGHCEAAIGTEIMSLLWYPSYRDFVQRTQKNFFGILGRFSLWRTWLVAAIFLWFSWFPLAMLLPYSHSWFAFIPISGWFALTYSTVTVNRWLRRPMLPSFFPMLGWAFVAWPVLRAGWLGWKHGGIFWRGILYPSSLLKANQRVKF